jgi:hypothetical protein
MRPASVILEIYFLELYKNITRLKIRTVKLILPRIKISCVGAINPATHSRDAVHYTNLAIFGKKIFSSETTYTPDSPFSSALIAETVKNFCNTSLSLSWDLHIDRRASQKNGGGCARFLTRINIYNKYISILLSSY